MQKNGVVWIEPHHMFNVYTTGTSRILELHRALCMEYSNFVARAKIHPKQRTGMIRNYRLRYDKSNIAARVRHECAVPIINEFIH